MNRTRKFAVASALAAGVLTGSVAPASAVPAEPELEHCQDLEDISTNAARRIARLERQVARLTERAGENPERAERIERRIGRINDRMAEIQERLAALEEFCSPRPRPDEVPNAEV